MTSGRIFYVIRVSEPRLRAALDAMRVVCNPLERDEAHITVRGPYSASGSAARRACQEALSARVVGREIAVCGVGTFFDDRQNTVYIRCAGDAISAVWKKKDYPFNPHLTIYDGSSRSLAIKIRDALNAHPFSGAFRASGVERLTSRPKQIGGLHLLTAVDLALLGPQVGGKLRRESLLDLQDDDRVELVELIVGDLARWTTERPAASAMNG